MSSSANSAPSASKSAWNPSPKAGAASATLDRTKLPLFHIAWPMLIENVLRASLMSVDTIMLSRYSKNAVSAMGFVNTYSFFIILLYLMVSVGASILITQNLGAGKRHEAGIAGVCSLTVLSGFSIILSAIVVVTLNVLLSLFGFEPEVTHYAHQFMVIFGGFSFFLALNIGQASILQAWGYPKYSMLINVLCLILTVIGNALCLFGPFGFPILGVAGVAASTVVSQIVACILYFFIIRSKKQIELPLKDFAKIPKHVYKSIVSVGIPTAGENLSYNISQMVIISMIAKMGTSSVATYVLLITILRYVFMPGISIGSGTQIKVGYLVGAGRFDEAAKKVIRYFALGFLISLVLIIIVKIWHKPILSLFTDDPAIFSLAASVLVISLFHEPGRCFNTIIIPGLKGAGDVRFPVLMGMVSVWGIGTLGSWILGIKLGWGLKGVWIALATDEWIRGIIMYLRWRSGAWKSKTLIPAAPVGNLDAA